MKIALDAMGGDHAPGVNIDGALAALAESDVEIALVGQQAVIEAELERRGERANPRLSIVDAPEVVGMHEPATTPYRRKRKSSLWIAATLVRDGAAAAMVSAGNTGATMISALKVMGVVEGVDRPALAAVIPTRRGITVILDAGANVDCKARQLREFAVMGHYYSKIVFGVETPRIGLLSIGEEEGKGNEVTRETSKVLRETGLNFVGNIEGNDIFSGEIDVVVCDGFVGNVVIKLSESLVETMMEMLKEEAAKAPQYALGFKLAKGAFRKFKKRLDYSEYGGAPLLGVRGCCIICHGRSNSHAIKNALRVARTFVERRFNEQTQETIGTLHRREADTQVTAQ